MNISFGKKIPIAQCQIQNKKTGKIEPATIHEYDCKSKNDALEVKKLGKDWLFASTISFNMQIKNTCHKENRPNNFHYFNIESQNGEILGIALCEETEDSFNVDYIETKQDGVYKYTGQSLLARLAEYSLDIGKPKIQITGAIESAKDFYERICGFTSLGLGTYKMRAERIPNFITRTNKRTQSPSIELRA